MPVSSTARPDEVQINMPASGSFLSEGSRLLSGANVLHKQTSSRWTQGNCNTCIPLTVCLYNMKHGGSAATCIIKSLQL